MERKKEGLLSIILPAYNENELIYIASDTISAIMKENDIPYEIIFVNDGSKDNTWDNIIDVSKKNDNVRGLCLSKNFGKESAMYAGLSNASGECVVILDCDLQHPPEKIVDMYRLWQEGYEVIEGVKASRGKESALHRFSAGCFYRLISKATGIDMSRASDYKLLDRKAVNVLLAMPEKNVFFRALSSWIGFKTESVEYHVNERVIGQSKWSVWSLVKYAIRNISAFSTAPMQLVTILGVIMLVISGVLGAIALVQKILGIALGGFTTVIIIQLFVGSIIMISLGIIGYYLARLYEEVKSRPRFVVANECGNKDNNTKIIG